MKAGRIRRNVDPVSTVGAKCLLIGRKRTNPGRRSQTRSNRAMNDVARLLFWTFGDATSTVTVKALVDRLPRRPSCAILDSYAFPARHPRVASILFACVAHFER